MAFVQNYVIYQLVNIINSKSIYFTDVSCENTNTDFEINTAAIGGCFRFQNNLQTEIQNLTVINSSSLSTTVGVKIIDDDNTLQSLVSSYNMNESQVKYSHIFLFKK